LDRERKRRGAAGGGRDYGGAMAEEVSSGDSDNHTSREKDGEQEGDSANSMEGSRAATMAWRRSRARFGGSVHWRSYGDAAPAVGSEGRGENGTCG